MSKKKNNLLGAKDKLATIWLLIVILAFFWDLICAGISNYIIPFTEVVPENLYIALLFILSPFVVAAFNIGFLKSERKLFASRHFWEFLMLTIYFVFKNSNNFYFYTVFGFYFDYIACMFISIAIIELLALSYRVSKRSNFDSKSVIPFYVDSPTIDDKYGRTESIHILLHKIHSTYNKYKDCNDGNSFTILISEEFGCGKTSLLCQLRYTIEKLYSESFIYIEFKPWLCDNPDSIIREFFRLLHNELEKHTSIPHGLFGSYVRQLVKQSPNNLYTFWIKVFCKQESLTKEHDTIKDCLAKIKRPIIITIDDVDRLQKEEIRVVLNLIRDTADFKNIFYVIAADKTNLKHSLESIEVKDTDSYLKKFINFEFLFPANDYVIKELLDQSLGKVLLSHFSEEDTRNLKDKMLGIANISVAFENPRDLYRFLNVYSYALDSVMNNGLKNDINNEDLFALTFIQYANPIVYKLLRDRDEIILTYNNGDSLSINEKCRVLFTSPSTRKMLERLEERNRTTCEKKKEMFQKEDELKEDAIRCHNEIYKEFVSFIFNKRNQVDATCMRYPDSYFRYFSYKLKNTQLLGSKVLQLISPDNDNFENDIINIITNNQEKSFVHIISRNLHTLKENQLNIFKKIHTFILQLCELKPEVVDRLSHFGHAMEVENVIQIYDLDSLMRSLYYDETKFDHFGNKPNVTIKLQYDKDKRELEDYIYSNTYDINVMSIFLSKAINQIECLIFSSDDYERWSRHIIDSFIHKMKEYTPHELFSNDILYTINHLSEMNNTYWADAFGKHLNLSHLYKEWLAHIIIYNDGKFGFYNQFTKQMGFETIDEWKNVLNKCDKIKRTKYVHDLLSVLNTDLRSIEIKEHPYLEYVKEYWSKNEIDYCLRE